MAYYELQPAYGRDYKTKAQVIADWNADKDFEGDYQLGFKPVNRQDLAEGDTVLLRYKRNTMVTSVKVSHKVVTPKPLKPVTPKPTHSPMTLGAVLDDIRKGKI